jgi:hypothetical protein
MEQPKVAKQRYTGRVFRINDTLMYQWPKGYKLSEAEFRRCIQAPAGATGAEIDDHYDRMLKRLTTPRKMSKLNLNLKPNPDYELVDATAPMTEIFNEQPDEQLPDAGPPKPYTDPLTKQQQLIAQETGRIFAEAMREVTGGKK